MIRVYVEHMHRGIAVYNVNVAWSEPSLHGTTTRGHFFICLQWSNIYSYCIASWLTLCSHFSSLLFHTFPSCFCFTYLDIICGILPDSWLGIILLMNSYPWILNHNLAQNYLARFCCIIMGAVIQADKTPLTSGTFLQCKINKYIFHCIAVMSCLLVHEIKNFGLWPADLYIIWRMVQDVHSVGIQSTYNSSNKNTAKPDNTCRLHGLLWLLHEEKLLSGL